MVIEKKLVCVLFNAGKKDELTAQCRERIQAGLAFENVALCFVGAKTEIMKTTCPNKIVIELNNCSDTIGNIREIAKFSKDRNFSKISIISHHYHLARIRILLNIFKLKAELISAEDVLGIKRRKSSLEYGLILGTIFYWFLGMVKNGLFFKVE